MITWVTVWVLSLYYGYIDSMVATQQTYATQQICERRVKYYNENIRKATARCDFQQVPIYIPKGGSK